MDADQRKDTPDPHLTMGLRIAQMARAGANAEAIVASLSDGDKRQIIEAFPDRLTVKGDFWWCLGAFLNLDKLGEHHDRRTFEEYVEQEGRWWDSIWLEYHEILRCRKLSLWDDHDHWIYMARLGHLIPKGRHV